MCVCKCKMQCTKYIENIKLTRIVICIYIYIYMCV